MKRFIYLILLLCFAFPAHADVEQSTINEGLIYYSDLTTAHYSAPTMYPVIGGSTYNGTVTNATVSSTHTTFDDIGEYVTLTNPIVLADDTEWSISFWHKSTLSGTPGVMGDSASVLNSVIRFDDMGTPVNNNLRIYNSSGTRLSKIASSLDLANGEWRNYVYTCDGSNTLQIELFIDGVSIAVDQDDADSSLSIDVIGNRGSDYAIPAINLAQVRIYNRVLSQAEITYLAKSRPAPTVSQSTINEGLVYHSDLTTAHYSAPTMYPVVGGSTYNGTVTNATVGADYTTFDESTELITLANTIDFAGNVPYSISFWWQYITGHDEVAPHILTGPTGGDESAVFFSTALNSLQFRNTASSVVFNDDPGFDVDDGVWRHIVVTCNGASTMAIFVDGVLIPIGIHDTTEVSWKYIGNADSAREGQNIAQLYIHNRVLTQAEITYLAKSRHTPSVTIPNIFEGVVYYNRLKTSNTVGATSYPSIGGSTYNGTVSNATVGSDYTVFDGNNEVMALANPIDFADGVEYTISFWRRYVTGTAGFVFSDDTAGGDSTPPGLFINKSTGVVNLEGIAGNLAAWTTTYDFDSTALWFHFVITCDATDTNQFKLYVNGVLFGSDQDNADSSISIHNIGNIADLSSSRYVGQLSELFIHNRVLSQAEITALYNRGWQK